MWMMMRSGNNHVDNSIREMKNLISASQFGGDQEWSAQDDNIHTRYIH